MDVSQNFIENFRLTNSDFLLSPEVLEGLGSSGRLVGSISTYPGTCQYPWSRFLARFGSENTAYSSTGTGNYSFTGSEEKDRKTSLKKT